MQFSSSRRSTGELRQLDMLNLTFCEFDIVQSYKLVYICGMGGGGGGRGIPSYLPRETLADSMGCVKSS